ncbi:MAG: transglutaminase [Myxococcaceae bacterium]|nr:MAG: transglutaminase [Myxococcaceae bacterium]
MPRCFPYGLAAFVDARLRGLNPVLLAEAVFVFVRDEVRHSWDAQGRRVTSVASEVLRHREGLRYAKSHLAAALLRLAGVPAGVCYQRLTLRDDDASAGHLVHALNTVYLSPLGRRICFDARGNRPGVDASFSLGVEALAFPIPPALGELDYLRNEPDAHPVIVAALSAHTDAQALMAGGLHSDPLRSAAVAGVERHAE